MTATELARQEREVGLAPDAPRAETSHRIVCVYATTVPRVDGGDGVAGLFGPRFLLHYARVEDLMPRIVCSRVFRGEAVELPGAAAGFRIESARTRVFAPVRGRLVVTLTLDFAGGDLRDALPVLDVTCHDRTDVKLAGEPVLAAAHPGGEDDPERRIYEADVHQIVMPARADRSLVDANPKEMHELLQSLVVREAGVSSDEPTYRTPRDLNMRSGEVAAIKSGVSVLRAKDPDLEVAATISAVQLLASLSELRRIRRAASEALETFEARRKAAPSRKRKEVAAHRDALKQLSDTLEQLQLDLAFGVETYTNMRLLVPQHLVYQFHGALAQSLDVPEGVDATDRMLARLHEVVGATRESVGAEERERDEIRHRRWAVVAWAAIPLTLWFSFLGINTKEVTERDYSAFDFDHFLPWYLALLCVLLIAALVAFAIERRR